MLCLAFAGLLLLRSADGDLAAADLVKRTSDGPLGERAVTGRRHQGNSLGHEVDSDARHPGRPHTETEPSGTPTSPYT